jgi:hypothetical protein
VTCKPARIEGLGHRPAVFRPICHVYDRLACRERARNSFLFPYYVVHGLHNSSVSSAVPYSCLLFSMCNAYAEISLLVLMYRVCSLCFVVTDLSDCPTYALNKSYI